jgi:hypothetical protein
MESSMSNSTVIISYHEIEKAISILPIILVITGTIGNSLAFYVLTSKRLRNYSTMNYFATLTIVDTVSLYQWNFNFFYRYNLNQNNLNLEETSLFLCRYVSFMAYFSLLTSAWILTLICVDRYLILTNTFWKVNSKKANFSLLIVASIIIVCALINIPLIFFNGEVTKTKISCYTTKYAVFWEKSCLYLEALIPLTIMIIFNILLIFKTRKSSSKLNKLVTTTKQSPKTCPSPKFLSVNNKQEALNHHSTRNLHSNLDDDCGIANLSSSHNNNNDKNQRIQALNYIIPHATHQLKNRHKKQKSKNRNEKILIMLILLTISFTVSTLPSNVFYAYFRRSLSNKPYRRVITSLLTCLRHLSHAFNFLIYFTYSSMIRTELKRIIDDFAICSRDKLFILITCNSSNENAEKNRNDRVRSSKIRNGTPMELTASHTSIDRKRSKEESFRKTVKKR